MFDIPFAVDQHSTHRICTSGEGGVRKAAFDSYAAAVDWTGEGYVTRALRVFESLIRRLDRESRKNGGEGLPPETVEELRDAFARDGCRLVSRDPAVVTLIDGARWFWHGALCGTDR
ncbi:hypothetical protein [Actinacidiphila oryziradicis]|uniref:Uncharacterized protein n=1 Tax=Actinacidiphila oryziradicis TaxID=2571141 RepID=A0A4U0R7V4_9ACTN|nr:hypothetical protein [Actinacidiphila oryziradicis]TJZ91171.1 hypothetical protein FCI23_55570 [Actinacidiphila oryziradicis]